MRLSEGSQAVASGTLYAHCDGGSRGNPGPAGFGAVLTGPNGEPVAQLSEFLGVRTNNFAEYSGLLAVLDYALEHGHTRLKVVSDSELMVKQIQGKYKVNSPDLKPLWQQARDKIAKLDAFEISHALRHKNKEADALANEAMDRGMGRTGSAHSGAVESLPLRPRPQARPDPSKTEPARPEARPQAKPSAPAAPPAMLRGFTRDGSIHVLGGAKLPDGIFVKIIPE